MHCPFLWKRQPQHLWRQWQENHLEDTLQNQQNRVISVYFLHLVTRKRRSSDDMESDCQTSDISDNPEAC